MGEKDPPNETAQPLEALKQPELVFGIISPLGIDLVQLVSILREELDRVGYGATEIRLSQLFRQVGGLGQKLEDRPEYDRILSHMKAGTELRSRTQLGGIMARLSIAAIRNEREKLTGFSTTPNPAHAFILRSLKHKQEVLDLHDIYGDGFVAISAYAPKKERIRALTSLLANSEPSAHKIEIEKRATELIDIDEAEEGNDLGQNVEGAFPLAHFFVEASDRSRLRKHVRRSIEILFGNHFRTPTRDEFGMYQAAAVARRSADLSRQVGAALFTPEGEIISVGCNDIPKAGGGLYWEEDDPDKLDGRDFALFGRDPSEQAKREIVAEFLEKLGGAKFLASPPADGAYGNMADDLIDGPLRGAQITSLLEFGRVLHAEMAAITDAARRGVSTKDSILFCTTFPCHLCARLIIAAGIKRVVFIEPYPKSKTHDLYYDSIEIDQLLPIDKKVSFQSFVGVAPQRYDLLFRMDKRRKGQGGKAVHWNATEAAPRIRRFQASYISIETLHLTEIPNLLHLSGLSWET